MNILVTSQLCLYKGARSYCVNLQDTLNANAGNAIQRGTYVS